MLIKIKLFGKLQQDKETIELTQKVGHYFKAAKIEVNGKVFNLFVDDTKKELYISKVDSNKKEEIIL